MKIELELRKDLEEHLKLVYSSCGTFPQGIATPPSRSLSGHV